MQEFRSGGYLSPLCALSSQTGKASVSFIESKESCCSLIRLTEVCTLENWCDELAKIPLQHEPGTQPGPQIKNDKDTGNGQGRGVRGGMSNKIAFLQGFVVGTSKPHYTVNLQAGSGLARCRAFYITRESER